MCCQLGTTVGYLAIGIEDGKIEIHSVPVVLSLHVVLMKLTDRDMYDTVVTDDKFGRNQHDPSLRHRVN